MGDVVSLNQPEPRIWVCDCGCSTSIIYENGMTECPNCGGITDDPQGGWFDGYDGKSNEATCESAQMHHVVQGNGSVEFARARITRLARDEDVCAMVVAKEDGSIHTWSEAETTEQAEWAREQFAKAADIIEKAIDPE